LKIVQFMASKNWGGLESFFVDLCNALSESVEVSVIVLESSVAKDKFNDRVKVYLLTSQTSRYNPFLYIEFYKILSTIKPALIHTHGAKATEICYKLNKVLNITHIATKHNARKGKIFNKISHVIAVSSKVKKSICHSDVVVIYNGINPGEVKPKNKNGIFTLLAVGRLDKIKGFDILIQECAKLDFPFSLQIVGEGEEQEGLEKLIVRLNLEDQINLLGFRDDIPQRMKDADVVVMSSHSEGFSLVMVEALFYANIFVSTRVSGAIEVLSDEFLIEGFKIANMMGNIYHDQERFKRDFHKLKADVKIKFLIENVVKEHMIYYKTIQDIGNLENNS